MDRSLDEIIGERPAPRGRGGRGGGRGGDRRGPPPMRAPRREDYPRDGVRKTRRDEPANLDEDWTHDRYEDDRYDRRDRRAPAPYDDRPPRHGGAPGGTKIRVDNLHYELTEEDLRDLFERIGPTTSVRLLYDRADRSLGTAYVIYEDPRDARAAVDDFDGQMANGQPIRLQLMPSGPGPRAPAASLADRMEKPPRSLFDRIEGGRSGGRQNSRDGGGRRRYRSDSPQKDRLAPPDVDRYVPGRGSRSPIRRRGTPREGGRRPGERRERGGGGRGGRGGRTDEEGRPVVGGRPKKTAEELDAEMADYWSGSKTDAAADNGAPAANDTNGGDIDMDI